MNEIKQIVGHTVLSLLIKLIPVEPVK